MLERNDAGNRQVVHFGHDAYMFPRQKGYFYNNTVVSYRSGVTTLVMENGDTTSVFDCRNNIIYVTAAGTNLEISNDSDGVVNLRNCWMKTGWVPSGSGGGTVNNLGGVVTGSSPGFVNEGGQDFHLSSSSTCINAGTSQHADCASYPVNSSMSNTRASRRGPPAAQSTSAPSSTTAASADLVITTTSLPNGQIGVAYSQTLAATGGATPYTWSVYSGSLPPGLTLGSSTGVISGTPTTSGTSNFTVRVTDSQGTPDTDDQALSITRPADLTITTTSLNDGQVGVAYSQTLAASGGTTPYSWSVSAGSLPAGLSMSTGGVISGTPTATGTANFTARVADSQSPADSATKALSIRIYNDLNITTTSLPAGTVGAAYSQTLAVTGGLSPYTWSPLQRVAPRGPLLKLRRRHQRHAYDRADGQLHRPLRRRRVPFRQRQPGALHNR